MTTIGFATIGESPRDDVVPYLLDRLGAGVDALQRGVLDGLSTTEAAALDDAGPGVHMVTSRRDGSKVRLAYDRVLPRMQAAVDELTSEGADLVVILCGADWTPVRSRVLVINPGRLYPNVVQALAWGKRLGVIKPDAGQIQRTIDQFEQLGIEAVVTAASPYGRDRLELADAAGKELAAADVDLVWMTCIGMDAAMQARVAAHTRTPTLLARAVLAGTIAATLEG